MAQYQMKAKSIPLHDEWDVIVAGGGPAGCTAAIAAAREGAKTLLIEATGALGGMGTMGLVPAWCPFSDGEKIVYKGLAEQIFQTCKDLLPHVPQSRLDWVAIDPEMLKKVYDDMVTEAGVSLLFHSLISDVETDGNGVVDTIVVSNKAGLSAYKAKVYIDCTGDGDVAAWAGAEFKQGDEETGELQAVTHCFNLGNVDEYGYTYSPDLHAGNNPQSVILTILEEGKYPAIPDKHMCNNMIAPRTVGFNASHIWDVDPTQPETVSEAMIEGRQIAHAIRDALAEYQPQSFANAFVAQTAPLMGIRESRRIIGDYVLTAQDYYDRRTFEDEIARNCYYLDIHAGKIELATTSEQQREKRSSRYNKGESHGIPYRCLTPKGMTNLLVAGRNISCDRPTLGSVRVMPVCLATGEAAGIAAAMALQTGDVHTIDVQDLRKRLVNYGAYIK